MSLELPLPPIPKTDKQKYYTIREMYRNQRFVGLYRGVHTGVNVEHEIHLLDGQIAFLEGCASLRTATALLRHNDLIAIVFQGRQSFMTGDGKERSALKFDVFVLQDGQWVPSFVLAKTATRLTEPKPSVIP